MANMLEISIEIIAHATEDVEKILKALGEFFDISDEEFSRQELAGHFDNPITMLYAKITKKDAKNFIENLVSKIPQRVMTEIIDDIENRIQDSTLHLRFGKQDLIKGEPILQQKDAVKVKITTPIYSKKDTVKKYVELLSHRS